MEHRIINLLTKRIELNLLYKLSYFNSNFALAPDYLKPALNNPAQEPFYAPAWTPKIKYTPRALIRSFTVYYTSA